jgi:hypothetical protein
MVSVASARSNLMRTVVRFAAGLFAAVLILVAAVFVPLQPAQPGAAVSEP